MSKIWTLAIVLFSTIMMVPSAGADTCGFDTSNPFTPTALTTAMSDASCDVIELPPGTYDMGTWSGPDVDHALTIRGSGRTVLIRDQSGDIAGRFTSTESDLTVEDLELQNFKVGIRVEPDASDELDIRIVNVTFADMDQAILGRNIAGGMRRFEVLRSTFRDVAAGIEVELATTQDVRIKDNRFQDLDRVAILLGTQAADPNEKRSKIFVRGNIIERVDGEPVDTITPYRAGIFVHGHFCFVEDNYIVDVLPPVPSEHTSGWSAGIYTKCSYAKIVDNTLIDSGAAPSAAASYNGAITLKGKERGEAANGDGIGGFGGLVMGNHVIYRDLSHGRRWGVKVHAGYTYVTDNLFENASVETGEVGTLDAVTLDADGEIDITPLP